MFLIMSVIIVCFLNYFFMSYEIEKLSQGYYSSNTVFFTIESNDNLYYKKIYAELNDSILFRDLDINTDVRGVMFKGDIQKPPIIEGRFLEENDFFNNKKVAVVGKSFKESIKKGNSRQYMSLFGEEYEVIGILGANIDSRLDRMILVNLDSITQKKVGLYAIDGRRNSNIQRTFTSISNYLDTINSKFDIVEREEEGIRRLLRYEKNNIYIFILLFIIFFLSSMSITLSWFEKNKCEISIYLLVGYGKKVVIFNILKKYFLLASIGFLSSFIILIPLSLINIIELVNVLFYYFIAYCATMFFCLIVVIVPITASLKTNVKYLISR